MSQGWGRLRSVLSSVKLGGGLLLLVGVLLLGAAVANAVTSRSRYVRLEKEGVVAAGTVKSYRGFANGMQGRARVEITSPEGGKSLEVDNDSGEVIGLGDKVTVRYVPSDPSVATMRSKLPEGIAGESLLFGGVSLVFLVVGVSFRLAK